MSHPKIEAAFAAERATLLAALIGYSRSFDLGEEALQEAFLAALHAWPQTGIPERPGAWLLTAGRRWLIDRARIENRRQQLLQQHTNLLVPSQETSIEEPESVPDNRLELPDQRLQLIFTCCHPALALDGQVALTLRTLGGLETEEIAKAFLVAEPTMAQRLVRAKRKIAAACIPYRIPPPEQLPERLPAVLAVLYLIFNAGYSSLDVAGLARLDLCREAIRLARLLHQLLPHPEAAGLLALLLLQDSRRAARVSAAGELVTLDKQDRSLWDHRAAGEGIGLIQTALTKQSPGPYQLQAAVAAVHAEAATAEATDWPQIIALYDKLYRLKPSPVIRLNWASAVGMARGWQAGLNAVEQTAGLENYYLWHATRAEFLLRLGRQAEAQESFQQALQRTTNPVEQQHLTGRIRALSPSPSGTAASPAGSPLGCS